MDLRGRGLEQAGFGAELEGRELALDPRLPLAQLPRHEARDGGRARQRGAHVQDERPRPPGQHVLQSPRHLLPHRPDDLRGQVREPGVKPLRERGLPLHERADAHGVRAVGAQPLADEVRGFGVPRLPVRRRTVEPGSSAVDEGVSWIPATSEARFTASSAILR